LEKLLEKEAGGALKQETTEVPWDVPWDVPWVSRNEAG